MDENLTVLIDALACIVDSNKLYKLNSDARDYLFEDHIKELQNKINIDILFISDEEVEFENKYVIPINKSQLFIKMIKKNSVKSAISIPTNYKMFL